MNSWQLELAHLAAPQNNPAAPTATSANHPRFCYARERARWYGTSYDATRTPRYDARYQRMHVDANEPYPYFATSHHHQCDDVESHDAYGRQTGGYDGSTQRERATVGGG